LDLVFEHPQCNAGHSAVEGVYAKVWEVAEGEEKTRFLEITNIIPRLINAEKENNNQITLLTPTNKGADDPDTTTTTTHAATTTQRQPYMPYLHRMALAIKQAGDIDPVFKAALDQMEGWSTHIKNLEELKEQCLSKYPVPCRGRNPFMGGGFPML